MRAPEKTTLPLRGRPALRFRPPAVITVLEPTLGATAKKATLRLVGTVIGGCVACAILASAESANGDRCGRLGGGAPARPLPCSDAPPSFCAFSLRFAAGRRLRRYLIWASFASHPQLEILAHENDDGVRAARARLRHCPGARASAQYPHIYPHIYPHVYPHAPTSTHLHPAHAPTRSDPRVHPRHRSCAPATPSTTTLTPSESSQPPSAPSGTSGRATSGPRTSFFSGL